MAAGHDCSGHMQAVPASAMKTTCPRCGEIIEIQTGIYSNKCTTECDACGARFVFELIAHEIKNCASSTRNLRAVIDVAKGEKSNEMD